MGSFAGPKKINKIFSITKMIPFILFLAFFYLVPVSEEEKKKLQSQVLESLEDTIQGTSENIYDTDAEFSPNEEEETL